MPSGVSTVRHLPMRAIVRANVKEADGRWDYLECGHRLPAGSAFKGRHCPPCGGEQPRRYPTPYERAERAAGLERLIRRIEWGHDGYCPECGGTSSKGHRDGCAIFAVTGTAANSVINMRRQS